MSPFVTLSDLSWSSPGGGTLFAGLDLSFRQERTGLVGRNGTGKTTLLSLICNELKPLSGTVRVSGTVGWLRQETSPRSDETVGSLLGVKAQLRTIGRADAGLATTRELAGVDWTLPARAEAALLRFGLHVTPQTPLTALSGGQRTRAALAALVLQQPDFLLLDEPTNNLDRDGRETVISALREWRGGAIVVSHDRELLREMDAIVELTTLGATRYGGNYAAYRARKDEELEAAHRDLAHAQKTGRERELKAREAAERKARRDSAGKRSRAGGGQAKSLLDMAKERAEASGGANSRLRDARRDQTGKNIADARKKIEILQPLRMSLPSTRLAAGKTVLRLDNVSGGHDPDVPVIRGCSFTITGPERVALTGPNGCGKTTLLDLISGALDPESGQVRRFVSHAFLDQQVAILDPEQSLRDNFRRLNPETDENHCRAALARFRFRSGDALQLVQNLSGGQKLRAGLACTLAGLEPPGLLILDEPTNHIDLDAIEALQQALKSYDGALLIVSHDTGFLRALRPDRTIDLSIGTGS